MKLTILTAALLTAHMTAQRPATEAPAAQVFATQSGKTQAGGTQTGGTPKETDSASTQLLRYVVRPQIPFSLHSAENWQELVIKFQEGHRIRIVEGRLTALDTIDLGRLDLSQARAILEGRKLERLFTRPIPELDRERAELQAHVPEHFAALADLNNYYRIRPRTAADAEGLVNKLNECQAIETAYLEPNYVRTSAPATAPVATADYTALQTYLDAAPSGVGYRKVKSIVGARFPDRSMAQLEGSWLIGHEDASFLATKNYLGQAPFGFWAARAWQDHGAACVGIMAGDRNKFGITGMGSAVKNFYLVSASNGVANMISLATAKLIKGDVMSSSFAPSVVGRQYPLDFYQAQFDAIRIATAKGIYYTIPAGNTSLDLDNTAIFGQRYVKGALSSGAFILGATEGALLKRVAFSNYGSRIDANGWGSAVVTIGFGRLIQPDPTGLHDYDNDFGGTSAATPMLAGVIATFTGILREQLGRELTHPEIRTALRSTGTPIPGPEDIGNRPDLVQLLALYNLPSGLTVPNDTTINSSFQLDISGIANEPFGLVLSKGRGQLPLLGEMILLNPSFLFPFYSGKLPGSAKLSLPIPVPNDRNLAGLDFYFQSVFLRGGTLKLSNSAELWIK